MIPDLLEVSPFHKFFLTLCPSLELLTVLLESPDSHQVLKWKVDIGKRDLNYLINNWTDGTASLVERTAQKSMADRLHSGREELQNEVQEMLTQEDKTQIGLICVSNYIQSWSTMKTWKRLGCWKWPCGKRQVWVVSKWHQVKGS